MKMIQRLLFVGAFPFLILMALAAIALFSFVSLGYWIATGKSFADTPVPERIRRHLPF